MSFPRYERYKDSGVEWLGEVPEQWEVAPLKRGFEVCLGKMLQPNAESSDDELLPYLRAANIQWGGVDVADVKQMWFSLRDREQLTLKAGDLLVSEGGDVGRSSLWQEELESCYFQNSVNRVRAHRDNSNRFLHYWMSKIKDSGYIDIVCNKSTIAHFTAEKVAAVPVPYPTLTEQQAIAAFLDRETSTIDALIAEQRRLIDLLTEKRQAVISHAVTKGLNPDAPMKDSGVEWLGNVPKHWECGPLKRFADVIDCKHYTVAFLDEGWPIVSIRELHDDRIDLRNAKRASQDQWDFLREGRVPQRGDMIFCRNASVGAVGYVDFEEPFCMGQDVCLIRPHTISRFMHYQLISPLVRNQIEAMLLGATIRRANVEEIRSLVLVCPPEGEQDLVSHFLDRETALIEALVAEAETAITLLQERRTALISAAVTGKIDLRGPAAREAAPAGVGSGAGQGSVYAERA